MVKITEYKDSDSDVVVRVNLGEVSYDIQELSLGKWMLRQVQISGPDMNELFIPAKLPSGHKISLISRLTANSGIKYLDKIIFDEAIPDFSSFAFFNVHAKEVKWPSSCHRIPKNCFKQRAVKAVTGIEQVVVIGSYAFEKSRVKAVRWPERCGLIPFRCFANSKLEKLEIPGEIIQIDSNAFLHRHLRELDLSRSLYCRFADCSLKGLSKNTNVILPYFNTDEEILLAKGESK